MITVDMVRVLLESNADCKMRNSFGRSPMDICNNATIRRILCTEDPTVEFVVVDVNYVLFTVEAFVFLLKKICFADGIGSISSVGCFVGRI